MGWGFGWGANALWWCRSGKINSEDAGTCLALCEPSCWGEGWKDADDVCWYLHRACQPDMKADVCCSARYCWRFPNGAHCAGVSSKAHKQQLQAAASSFFFCRLLCCSPFYFDFCSYFNLHGLNQCNKVCVHRPPAHYCPWLITRHTCVVCASALAGAGMPPGLA